MITLNTEISQLSRVGKTTARKLAVIDIRTVQDLLFYFPYRYDDFSQVTSIDKLRAGERANIVGQIELIQNKRSFRRRMYVTEALVNDATGEIKVIWFNQPFIGRNLKSGDKVSLAGKVDSDFTGLLLSSPTYEKITAGGMIHTQGLVPNYHLTANITQKQIRFLIKQVIVLADAIPDWLPAEVITRQKLLSLSAAIKKIHFPKNWQEIENAKTRLAFNELFLIQLRSQLIKKQLQDAVAPKILFKDEETKEFVNSLPFLLTPAQKKSAWEILQDIDSNKPMSRLLEGDVGSGKTVVAVMAMLNVFLNGKQSVLMAPTEILAEQHYETIRKLLKNYNIRIGLVTGSSKVMNHESRIMNEGRSSKKVVRNSLFIIRNSDIIIGTHALIQEKISFKNLALAIIDEQHRFGVHQRSRLTQTYADFTQTNTDKNKSAQSEKKSLLYEELTYKIRGAIFNVKKQLGLGHKEIIYQKALEQELHKIGLSFEREKSIDIKYDDKKIGIYRPDFIIENKIILELKKLPFVGKIEKKQIWHYLKGSEYELALLVNFANTDVQIERFIHTHPHESAISQHKSVLSPHLLSLTATPIPRTLALALYGDLDLSIINQMPTGRKPILTKVVPEEKRQAAYNFIRQQINAGRQVFVICPLIDVSDKLGVKSVKEEYKKLNEVIFPDINVGMLHGRLKTEEKKSVMADFKNNKTKVIVSTSVVEVGIDVPNATIMMIEGADRFGLAQLHQFRGRVGRSKHQSYCFLFTDNDSEKTLQRLSAMEKYNDGFALSKIDLKFRGPGELYGLSQSGFPELQIASLFDYALIKRAHEEVQKIAINDIKKYPELIARAMNQAKTTHLE